ncbi:iron ABC transporter permease [Chelativorans sp. AA-79]|uniref:ABC transporter permease n=1 Tax=Chelativorans sp. AA-79 TaxID=3028735 RepID=UPI0023F85F3F|nr:iron ABC transporter permease [Chelativorans sp. AA-79]WEX08036.1 iron ABC transporter permease [Chelativorans sp. AA-79]
MAGLVVIAVIALLSLLPTGRLLLAAIAPGGELDLTTFLDRLGKPSTLRAAWNTLDTAFLGAVLAVAIGAPFAVAVALTDLPSRKTLGFLLLLPLIIAPQVMALSWLHLTGPSSTLLNLLGVAPPPGTPNPMLGRGGIILLYGIQHAPIVFVTLRAGLVGIPGDLVEAARASGAGATRAFLTIVAPLMRPWLAAAGALAFVSGIGNFGIPALLGLPVNYLTLSTLIYRQMSSFGPGVLPQMASLSVLIAMLALVGIAMQGVALRGHRARYATGKATRFALGRWRVPLTAVCWAMLTAILLLPGLALVTTSVVPAFGVPLTFQTFTLVNFEEVLMRQASTMRAFRNSASLAGAAALILSLGTIPVAMVMERFSTRNRKLLHATAELPYALPGVVLAIACILLFLRPLPLIGSLYATAWIILIAYLMRFLILAMKPVASAVAQIPPELDEAAAVFGASPLRRILSISAPLAAPAAVAGALLVFMSAFNELTVSALLWSSGNETLGVVLFSLEEAGLATHAAAIAVATVVVVVALLAALDRLAGRLPSGVLPWR